MIKILLEKLRISFCHGKIGNLLVIKLLDCFIVLIFHTLFFLFNLGKGGKNRRRGKNENETEKRELVFREDGQGNIYIYNGNSPNKIATAEFIKYIYIIL